MASHGTLVSLIDRLDSTVIEDAPIIQWGSPVPFFGDLAKARVATLGLNPSNREFVDDSGEELQGANRRFHSLNSLGLQSWSEADARHIRLILRTCQDYFRGNSYDRWFKRLDKVLSGTGASYYSPAKSACHLDIIPYATLSKWTELTAAHRNLLLGASKDTFARLLLDSGIRVIILNGRSVVHYFEKVASITMTSREMKGWALPRRSGPDVSGFAFRAHIDSMAGIDLGREVLALGFNHNIQSSFGVSSQVLRAIASWLAQAAGEVLDET